MTIRHLSYVACDRCGDPAQPSAENAEGARGVARGEGYRRVAGNTATENQDVCRKCLRADDHVIRA